MMNKKGLVVLVIVAIALVLISVRLAVSDSTNEVPTERGPQSETGTGKVGINIVPQQVEDKLSGDTNGE